MTLTSLAKRLEKMVVDNSPVILTAIGVTGTLTTVYLTGRATFKAAEVISYGEQGKRLGGRESFEFRDKVELVWKFYIPPAITGLLTVVSIIGANRIGGRRAAALAAAYSLSEKAFDEYKSKVVEKIGARKEQAARDELAQERVDRDPVDNNRILMTETNSVLCYEVFTGRYFLSDMETLRKAQNDTNHQVIHDSYASLTDFYDRVGLPKTGQSDEIGWNLDRMLELQFSPTLSEGGVPCISVEFNVAPIRHYSRLS